MLPEEGSNVLRLRGVMLEREETTLQVTPYSLSIVSLFREKTIKTDTWVVAAGERWVGLSELSMILLD